MYVQIFWIFFITNILGFGGGASIIPLIENEIVQNYGWYTSTQFSEMLAVANALPGPIATKIAGYIGFEMGGVFGAVIALLATIVPSLVLLMLALKVLKRYKNSPQVSKMTNYIKPIIAVMLAMMGWSFVTSSIAYSGLVHTVILLVASFLLLWKTKIPPVFIILGSMVYGALLIH